MNITAKAKVKPSIYGEPISVSLTQSLYPILDFPISFSFRYSAISLRVCRDSLKYSSDLKLDISYILRNVSTQ